MNQSKSTKQSGLGYARPMKSKARLSNDIEVFPYQNQVTNIKSQSTNNLMYNALLQEINEDEVKYMTHLAKQCQQRKNQSHLRSKTIKTAGSSPCKDHSPQDSRVVATPADSLKQYRTVTPKATSNFANLKSTQKFFSRNFQEHEHKKKSAMINEYQIQAKDDKFLCFLDNYVDQLSRQSGKQQSSMSESGENISKKIVAYENKLKQMQFMHEMQSKKYHKKEKAMKQKLSQMNDHVIDLTIRLKHEHQQRKRFQRLFLEYQKQIKLMRHDKLKDLDLSFSSESKDFNLSVNSEFQQSVDYENYKQGRYQKSSIKDSEVQMNTSQKISRFLRKPFNDVRSTKPGMSISDQQEEY